MPRNWWRKASGFSVGARWRYTDPWGAIGEVCLSRAEEGYEMWEYQFRYSDDPHWKRDYAPSRAKAVELCGVFFGYRKGAPKPRFRRVEDVENDS